MNKTKIFFIILVIFANILIFNFNEVRAEGISDVIKGGDSFLSSAKQDEKTKINQQELKSTSSNIYNILLIIGIIVAVLVAAILGMQFMLGSVEEQAKVKESLVPFVIGCIVVFGAFGFWKLFVEIGNDFEQTQYIDEPTTMRNTDTTTYTNTSTSSGGSKDTTSSNKQKSLNSY